MKSNDDIAALLTREIALRAHMEPEEIKPDAHFVLELGLSSLDMLNVLAFTEKSFSVRFPDETLGDLTTLNKVIKAIARHQQHQAAEIK